MAETASLDVRVHERPDEVAAGEWGMLTARPPASLTGSRAWACAAFATVDRGCTPFLLAVRDGGRLVGLLPLVRDGRAARALLRFAATPFNDLSDALTLPGHELAAGRAAIDALRSEAVAGCDVALEAVDPDGTLAASDRGRRLLAWSDGDPAPTIDLRAFPADMSPRLRRRLDRALARLRAAHRVELLRLEGRAAADAVEAFVRLRTARLRALRRDPALPPVPLLDAAVRALAPRGRCCFVELRVDGAVVAQDLYLLDGTIAMLWLRALDMAWARHSCGHLLLRGGAELLAHDGYATLDLGRGDEPYKFAFGARPRVLLGAGLRSRSGPAAAATN